MADVSSVLWDFVMLGATLDYSDLCDTREYRAMCDAVHDPGTRGAIRVTARIASHIQPGLQRIGVQWDSVAGAYTFDDAEVLMRELPWMLAEDCPDFIRAALSMCRSRITSTVRALDLADELGGMCVG